MTFSKLTWLWSLLIQEVWSLLIQEVGGPLSVINLFYLFWYEYLLPFPPFIVYFQCSKSAFRNSIQFLIVIVLETLAYFAVQPYFYLLQMMIC